MSSAGKLSVKSQSAKKILAKWLKENDPTMLEWFAACKQMAGEHTYSYTHNDALYEKLKEASRAIKNAETKKITTALHDR